VAAETEHGEGDEGDEGAGWLKTEGDAGEESDLGVHGLDPAIAEAAFDGSEDRGAVLDG
jgi:hypothetical protein